MFISTHNNFSLKENDPEHAWVKFNSNTIMAQPLSPSEDKKNKSGMLDLNHSMLEEQIEQLKKKKQQQSERILRDSSRGSDW